MYYELFYFDPEVTQASIGVIFEGLPEDYQTVTIEVEFQNIPDSVQ